MLAFIIISIGILSRVVWHTPNFTPVLALALFGGIYLKGRQGHWVPLVLMALSDIALGFHDTMLYTWGSVLLISAIGVWLRTRRTWLPVMGGAVVSALLFFVVTNFGAYLSIYPRTWAGLQECYIAAVPFFRSTFVSTLAYSAILFAVFEMLTSRRGTAIDNK